MLQHVSLTEFREDPESFSLIGGRGQAPPHFQPAPLPLPPRLDDALQTLQVDQDSAAELDENLRVLANVAPFAQRAHPDGNPFSIRAFWGAVHFLILSPALCWSWQGKVVGVSDGDTITVMHDGKGERVRLYGVDAPEKDQDSAEKAKQFTADMVFGEMVHVVKPINRDRYWRTMGRVTYNG